MPYIRKDKTFTDGTRINKIALTGELSVPNLLDYQTQLNIFRARSDYDIVVGSLAEYNSGEATHFIDSFAASVVDGNRIKILGGTHNATANISISAINLIIDIDSDTIINLASTYTFTLSGTNNQGVLRFANTIASGVTLSGAGSSYTLLDTNRNHVVYADGVNVIISGLNGSLAISKGSALLPAYSFSSDTNTGLYWIAADRIGVSTGGTLRFDISTTAITSTLPFYNQDGSVSAPAITFTNNIDTGLYYVTDEIGVSINGVEHTIFRSNELDISSSADGDKTLRVASDASFGWQEVNDRFTLNKRTSFIFESNTNPISGIYSEYNLFFDGKNSATDLRQSNLGLLGARDASGTPFGLIDFINYDLTTLATYIGARIASENGTGAADADLIFYTNDSGATDPDLNLIQRLRIYEDGSVSIGSTGAKKGANTLYVQGGIYLPDSSRIYFGNGNDLSIYHDGTTTNIFNGITGSIYSFRVNDVETISFTNTAGKYLRILNNGLSIKNGTFETSLVMGSLTNIADRTITLTHNDANRIINLSGNLTLANDFVTSGAFSMTLTSTAITNVTLPTTGTLSTLANTETFTNKIFRAVDGTAGAPGFSWTSETTSGLYRIGANTIGISTNSLLRLSIGVSDITSTLPFYNQDGTVTAPAITFTGDNNTGLYWISADKLGVSTAGTLRLSIGASDITSTLPIYNQNGTAVSPAITFTGDNNTGIYWAAADNIAISTGGTGRFSVSSVAVSSIIPYYIQDGTWSAPSYTFNNSTNTGLFLSAVGILGVTSGGRTILASSNAGMYNIINRCTVYTSPSVSVSLGVDSAYIHVIDLTTPVNYTVYLPAVASNLGLTFHIKNMMPLPYTVTIDPNASETIDDAPTYTLNTTYEAVTIVATSGGWIII